MNRGTTLYSLSSSYPYNGTPACTVDILVKAGKLPDAESLIDQMPLIMGENYRSLQYTWKAARSWE